MADVEGAFHLWKVATGVPALVFGIFLPLLRNKVKERDTSESQYVKYFLLFVLLPFGLCSLWAAFGLSQMDAIAGIEGSATRYTLQGFAAAGMITFTGLFVRWVFMPKGKPKSGRGLHDNSKPLTKEQWRKM